MPSRSANKATCGMSPFASPVISLIATSNRKARINATLRLIGCELEDLTVQLLRQGQVVQTKRVNAQQSQELPVEFEVAEPETGQYEYEVHVQPLENEVDTANNSAITYLNVIDQQIRVLVLEGRSLLGHHVPATLADAERQVRRGCAHPVTGPTAYARFARRRAPAILHLPETLDQFAAYDVVILGRAVDSLAESAQPESSRAIRTSFGGQAFGAKLGLPDLLDQYVKDRGGTVIFSRGHAFQTLAVRRDWSRSCGASKSRDHVHLDVTAEGRGLSPFRS